MKTRFWSFLVVLLLLSLTACQSAPPIVASTQPAQPSSDTATPVTPAAMPTSDVNAYPAPAAGQNSNSSAYPAPNSAPLPTATPAAAGSGSGSVLYPDPQSGDNVFWNQAEAMILNGEVVKITRDGETQVTIDLKDGRSLIVKGVTEKTVQDLLQTCGDLCKDIQLAP